MNEIKSLHLKFEQIEEQWQNSKFPLFCKVLGEKETLFKQLAYFWAIAVPDLEKQVIRLDYSWSNNEDIVHRLYPQIADVEFKVKDLVFHELGYIPTDANPSARFGSFVPTLNNHVVTIDLKDVNSFTKNVSEASASLYKRLAKSIGVIIRIEPFETDCLVSFKSPSNVSTVASVPTAILVRLPESLRTLNVKYTPLVPEDDKKEEPEQKTEKAVGRHKKSVSKSKFQVGSIVRANAAITCKALHGLMGVVTKVTQVTGGMGFSTHQSHEYEVDFGTLPTMNLLHSVGEHAVKLEQSLREFDIEDFDYDTCSMPHLLLYTVDTTRRDIWLCPLQVKAFVNPSAQPRVINGSIHFDVDVVGGKKYTVPHYSLDYLYDKSALLKSLGMMKWVTMGVEEDYKRHWCYLYAGMDDALREVFLRIRLGALKETPSLMKRFGSFEDFRHPWQVKRYLARSSLGYFWQVIKPEEYIGKIPNFVVLDQEESEQDETACAV